MCKSATYTNSNFWEFIINKHHDDPNDQVSMTLVDVISGKTWYGCGQHIAYAMSQAPKEEWCTCVSTSGTDIGEFPPKYGDGKQA
ncbi:hypothetical protein DFJ63DRAFT_334190 [Scheffersomyces coipomensis]|uniref:uncharacterized protein n=1 Tax=Scheffersomyces coipomensis TaxID=1788519 RepID=UPI00315DD1C3